MNTYILILIITTNFAGSHITQVKFTNKISCEQGKEKSKELIGGRRNDSRITDVRGVCLPLAYKGKK